MADIGILRGRSQTTSNVSLFYSVVGTPQDFSYASTVMEGPALSQTLGESSSQEGFGNFGMTSDMAEYTGIESFTDIEGRLPLGGSRLPFL